jgi:hypothetical protein
MALLFGLFPGCQLTLAYSAQDLHEAKTKWLNTKPREGMICWSDAVKRVDIQTLHGLLWSGKIEAFAWEMRFTGVEYPLGSHFWGAPRRWTAVSQYDGWGVFDANDCADEVEGTGHFIGMIILQERDLVQCGSSTAEPAPVKSKRGRPESEADRVALKKIQAIGDHGAAAAASRADRKLQQQPPHRDCGQDRHGAVRGVVG